MTAPAKLCAHCGTETARRAGEPLARFKKRRVCSRSCGAKSQSPTRNYGITIDDFDAMLAAQGGGCAICGATESPDSDHRSGRRRSLHVDHCHSTGKVRGLLCSSCNKALGLFKDSPAALRSAAAYLERA